jgi:hypothetical protein
MDEKLNEILDILHGYPKEEAIDILKKAIKYVNEYHYSAFLVENGETKPIFNIK